MHEETSVGFDKEAYRKVYLLYRIWNGWCIGCEHNENEINFRFILLNEIEILSMLYRSVT